MGKVLIVLGTIIVVIGIILHWFPNALQWFGRLPGDIRIEGENSTFFFPITTMILISLVLSLIGYFFRQ